MRKKRTVIISLLLVAALALGIGYAGFSVNMIVNGDAKMNGIASQVVFESATLTDNSGGKITLNKNGENSDALSIKLDGFKEVGDTATVTVVISNPHDFDVKVDLVTFTSDNKKNGAGVEYLDVTHTFPAEGITIAHNQSNYTFTFTVTCGASTPDPITENFELKLLAQAGSSAATTTQAAG